ncbi:PREDICTED: uncharacterized protein LOC106815905 [Priapulus caudatus]|uniref:Uncharacterized protein LOC106815905 n=1 Tax=Priapulus caudatus TaxID=37621 RepID=A0ABM1EUP7_PRICU|nr:PREDICTED: uncharacterized protein LOC106815905 [Priapulus caudatus]
MVKRHSAVFGDTPATPVRREPLLHADDRQAPLQSKLRLRLQRTCRLPGERLSVSAVCRLLALYGRRWVLLTVSTASRQQQDTKSRQGPGASSREESSENLCLHHQRLRPSQHEPESPDDRRQRRRLRR